MVRESIPVVSIFSGAGGLDFGFQRKGFEPVMALDSDESAVKTYNANFRLRRAEKLDLRFLTVGHLLDLVRALGIDETPRGMIGGPPCQTFSNGNARRRKKPDDRRGGLGIHYARLLASLNKEFGLDFFVFENVTGLRRAKHSWHYRRIHSALRNAGFRVFESELDASAFGVPQKRHRLLLVGINERRFPWLQFEFPEGSGGTEPSTVRDAIAGLPRPTYFRRGLKPKDISYHPNHWCMQPKSPKFGSKRKKGSDGRSFKRLSWDKPSRTVAYGNREVHLHPRGHRRLSVLEAMLLQGFPKSYRLKGTLSAQISQISNAVPPPLAAALAQAIRDQLYAPITTARSVLLKWFQTNRRDFPWRKTRDPFKVLVAEKLLQQTAASPSVVASYSRLVASYPDWKALCAAKQSDVEQIIAPLGLHYRAAELVHLARTVCDRHAGALPSDRIKLLALPGVGEYCARAVQTFAFGIRTPIVDTNVARFLRRYFGMCGTPMPTNPARSKVLLSVAESLLPANDDVADFNLAVLDLCAAHCRAERPDCAKCPLRLHCASSSILAENNKDKTQRLRQGSAATRAE